MSKVTPFIRPDRKNKSGKCTIYLRFEVSGDQATLSTGEQVLPSHWNDNQNRVRSIAPYAEDVNAVIESRLGEAHSVRARFKVHKEHVTATKWRDALIPSPARSDFIAHMEDFISDLHADQFHYRRRLKTTLNKIKCVLGPEIPWEEFDLATLDRLDHAWKEKDHAEAYRSELFKSIRTVYRDARKKGLIPPRIPDPFVSFDRPRQTPANKLALSKDQVLALQGLTLEPGSSLERARDIFVFCIFAHGMRFSDAVTLRWSDVNGWSMTYTMRKTGDVVREIQLNDWMQKTLAKYEKRGPGPYVFLDLEDEIDPSSTKLYNRISAVNADCNRSLKKLAKMAGMPAQTASKVTTHVARHTFANILMDSSKSLRTVQTALCHHKASTTDVYLQTVSREDLNEKVSDAFADFDDRRAA